MEGFTLSEKGQKGQAGLSQSVKGQKGQAGFGLDDIGQKGQDGLSQSVKGQKGQDGFGLDDIGQKGKAGLGQSVQGQKGQAGFGMGDMGQRSTENLAESVKSLTERMMADRKAKQAAIAKVNRRIKAEVKKLSEVLGDVPEDRLKAADGVIKRAAYMRITLEDYEVDLIENGHTELFTQSEKTDPYDRERPVARLYNTMLRNYVTTMKQLFDLLPDGKPGDDKAVDPAYEKFFGGK